MHLSQWASEQHGLGEDWYTAFQFDRAVGFVGNWIESKLAEFDKATGKPLHDLETLLADEEDGPWWEKPMELGGLFKLMAESGLRSQIKYEKK